MEFAGLDCDITVGYHDKLVSLDWLHNMNISKFLSKQKCGTKVAQHAMMLDFVAHCYDKLGVGLVC